MLSPFLIPATVPVSGGFAWPNGRVKLLAITVSGAWLTTIERVVEGVTSKIVSPPKVATRGWVPAVNSEVLNVACNEPSSVAVARGEGPSGKVTEPPGGGSTVPAATVAGIVTLSP